VLDDRGKRKEVRGGRAVRRGPMREPPLNPEPSRQGRVELRARHRMGKRGTNKGGRTGTGGFNTASPTPNQGGTAGMAVFHLYRVGLLRRRDRCRREKTKGRRKKKNKNCTCRKRPHGIGTHHAGPRRGSIKAFKTSAEAGKGRKRSNKERGRWPQRRETTLGRTSMKGTWF